MRTNPESGALSGERRGPLVSEVLAAASAARGQRAGAPEAAAAAAATGGLALLLNVVVEPVSEQVRWQGRHLRLQLARLWRSGRPPGPVSLPPKPWGEAELHTNLTGISPSTVAGGA